MAPIAIASITTSIKVLRLSHSAISSRSWAMSIRSLFLSMSSMILLVIASFSSEHYILLR